LIAALVAVEGRPWAEYGRTGKPISQNQLARALKPLGVSPDVNEDDGAPHRGYAFAWFGEAFSRYLPSEGLPNRNPVTNADGTGTSDLFQSVTSTQTVTVEKCEKSNNDGLSYGVTVVEREKGEEAHSEPESPSGAEVLGRAPPGERCDLCGKGGSVMRVRQPGGQVLHIHPGCARRVGVDA
jgi:Protein of unknown function (DUF3631)